MSEPINLKFAIIAADTVALTIIEDTLHVRLLQVRSPEFAGKKGVPGGLIDPQEEAEISALRHLATKGGVVPAHIEQFFTFSGVNRDKRGRVLSIGYLALVPEQEAKNAKPSDWSPAWYPLSKLPPLAYDHADIIRHGLERLRGQIGASDIARGLLPDAFSLTDLQRCTEIVLGQDIDKRNFRRKVLTLGLLDETGETRIEGAHRPAALYRFGSVKTALSTTPRS